MTLRVATFNAGLAVGLLPYATQRLPQVIESLAALDVDLLFVQEFWLEPHWSLLCRALSPRLPHTFRPEPVHLSPQGACTADQVKPLMVCAEARCAGLRDEALARCAVEHCAAAALSLSTECLNCIASHPLGSLEEIIGRCLGEPPADTRNHERASAPYGGLIAYGGSFGTGLLSRVPLEDRDMIVFESTVNARGALYARIETRDFGPLAVFAVHFSPGGVEQPPQVDRLLDFIDEKAGRAPALLLGDLNMTQDSSLFRRLERIGFQDAATPDRRGTYTHDGLGTGRVTDHGWRLDHVLCRGLDAAPHVERVLDRPVQIEVEGRRLRTTLSDHFGVLATFDGGH